MKTPEREIISIEEAKLMMASDYNWDRHSTKQLLAMLRDEVARDYTVFRSKLKEVLSTRENIPTKAQAKEMRRARAKEQRSR